MVAKFQSIAEEFKKMQSTYSNENDELKNLIQGFQQTLTTSLQSLIQLVDLLFILLLKIEKALPEKLLYWVQYLTSFLVDLTRVLIRIL